MSQSLQTIIQASQLNCNGTTPLNNPTPVSKTFDVNKIYPVTITPAAPPAPEGPVFYVSATQQVVFTRGNLYENGSGYHLEANQASISNNVTNQFAQDNLPTTVDGESGLTLLTDDEWNYILLNYTNRTRMTIDGTTCLVIAGVNYQGGNLTSTTYNTASDIPNTVLCLPFIAPNYGAYWTSATGWCFYFDEDNEYTDESYGGGEVAVRFVKRIGQ